MPLNTPSTITPSKQATANEKLTNKAQQATQQKPQEEKISECKGNEINEINTKNNIIYVTVA